MENSEPFKAYNSTNDMTSASLVQALQDGDQQAWEKIALIWGQTLLHYFGRKGLQPSDCEEITQNVMIKMYSAMTSGKFSRDGKQKKLKHWVYAIAQNELRTFYERFHNKPKSPGGTVHQDLLANLGSQEDSTSFESVLVSKLLEVIKGDFEESTWKVFKLYHFENVPTPEIATTLQIKEGTVRQKIHRVKQRLKQELEFAIDKKNENR